jgi:hypothetical protein
MVDTQARYDHLILLSRRRAFHFNGRPPDDIRTDKYLFSRIPDEVISSILARAQTGDFTQFSRLIDLLKSSDDAVVWGRCAMLLSYAAPFSALHALIDAYRHELFETDDVVTQQWISEILCRSGALWSVPVVMRIFRRNHLRNKYFATPRYLSRIVESRPGEIADGPAIMPRTDDLPAWFDVPPVYDDDTYEELVLRRYAAIRDQIQGFERLAFNEGEPLNLARIAERALTRIGVGEDTEEIAIARTLLEAGTGKDLSAFYQNGSLQNLKAASEVEFLLDSGELTEFEPGSRYFFGRKIPD